MTAAFVKRYGAIGPDMVAGRWFGREDNGATPPVVVNRAFAEALYGSAAAAVGQPFREGDFVRVDDFVGTVLEAVV